MRQATLVAFYGAKPPPLEGILRSCQERISQSVRELGAGVEFRPYSLAQIHATMVGLERWAPPGFENRNFRELRGRAKVMRLAQLFDFLRTCDYFPFHAQFGGFDHRDYPFQSRGARPYERSFSLEGRIAVMIGWPVRDAGCTGDHVSLGAAAGSSPGARAYPTVLEDLRKGARTFGVLHRWHQKPQDVDNDLYLRLGMLETELPNRQAGLLQDAMRRALSAAPPTVVRLAVSDLAVVAYPTDDETLPEDRSLAFRLADPRLCDQDFLADLYA
jgi:hypothetical protein